jgi:hypothetical protein
MTAQFPSLAERRSANAQARHFNVLAAKGLRSDAQAAIDSMVHSLWVCREARVSSAYLKDALFCSTRCRTSNTTSTQC